MQAEGHEFNHVSTVSGIKAGTRTLLTISISYIPGFAMVAMVELQINEPTNVPEWLFVMFAVCTTVLVAVHIFALMISTYLLPNIDAVSKMETPGGPVNALRDSPHERMRGFIELAWAFSTVLGMLTLSHRSVLKIPLDIRHSDPVQTS